MSDKQKLTRNNGKFAKGYSGNPRGRPPVLLPEVRERLDKATPDIIEKIVEKALKGDLAAAKIVLNRTAPISKPSSQSVVIPNLNSSDSTLSEKAETILSSIASGSCPPDIGVTLIQSISTLARVVEFDDLKRRVEALEALDGL
ncbi:hypothetical protein XMG59_002338 [Marinobacterium sp. xm-g-59]|uniref:DUF5681 domain-containing protein n=1 Tax=Marinobacterium sp. xm-g-59 TaxID=2497748 RepID=UPI0015680DE0|nr:DUF5681 domain-containing protein [Marinobacterium sp. xm-g-59]NRP96219.1 hypothetical protein [Marinobacterium sp. xm-g-59]